MAKKGYLKIAMDKITKKGNPFVSLLILDSLEDEEGQWMSLFDAWWFGGLDGAPSPYDIRRYADKDDPGPVVYEAEEKGKYVTCMMIRPDDEQWEGPEGSANVGGEQKPIEKLFDEPPRVPADEREKSSKEVTLSGETIQKIAAAVSKALLEATE